MSMKQNKHPFSSSHFASAGFEKSGGEYGSEDRAMFQVIRSHCPELHDWGDLPVGVAWGGYSQNVYLLSWLEENKTVLCRKYLIEFLAYILWHEVKGEPKWGITPEELKKFAAEHSIT